MSRSGSIWGQIRELSDDGVLASLQWLGGRVFYVHNGDGGDQSYGTKKDPLKTLDVAIGKCKANNGDVVILLPGHFETITGAGGVTADIAGITILGVGHGNDMPTLLMDGAATVTFAVTAAGVRVSHLRFKAGHADIVACIAATKNHLWVDDCEFVENVATENFLTEIKHTSTANGDGDGLRVTNCRVVSADAAALEFIEINATASDVIVTGNFVTKPASTSGQLIVVAAGKILTGAEIAWNKLQNAMTANELFFSSDGTTNTGVAYDNYCAHRDVTTTHDLGLESSGIDIFNLWSTSTAALQGGVIPAADTNA